MDGLGHHVLARAGGPLDEDRGVAGGHGFDLLEDLLHGRVPADDLVEGEPLAQDRVQVAGEGEILDRSDAAHDLAGLVGQGHVVGPHGNGLAVPGGHPALSAGAGPAVLHRFPQQMEVVDVAAP